MIFWVILWLVSLLVFLFLPILCVDKRRERWWQQIRTCLSNVRERSNGEGEQSSAQQGRPNYVISKQQEDAIRESFLTESLRMFTMSLTSEMVSNKPSPKHDQKIEEQVPEVDVLVPSSTGETLVTSAGAQDAETTATDNRNEETTTEAAEDAHCTNESATIVDDESPRESDIESGLALQQQPRACDNNSDCSDDESIQQLRDATNILDDGPDGFVTGLPFAGDCRHDLLPASKRSQLNDDVLLTRKRDVANACAICLSTFEADVRLTWASNPDCEHVFHHDCILDWLRTSGAKYLKKILRDQERGKSIPPDFPSDPIERITSFPMLCPCCRQIFVAQRAEDGESESETNDDGKDDTAPGVKVRVTPDPGV